jgi:magnesium-transporting ATPase (P-type)
VLGTRSLSNGLFSLLAITKSTGNAITWGYIQANNGFTTVMEIAVLLAAGLRQWIDFGVIIGILLLNAVVGWYQEKQAADVVASLKGDIAMRSTVVRDGQEQEIKARELVPGDIVSSITISAYNITLPQIRQSVTSTTTTTSSNT